MSEAVHLADVNVLIALVDGNHPQHRLARKWLDTRSVDARAGSGWATCLLTQAGFVRVMANPRRGGHRMEEAVNALALLTARPEHRFLPMVDGFDALSAPFADRLFGHQQVTDACLLGLAVREDAVLVTMDKGISHLAGAKYRKNLLLLETS